MNPDAIIFGGSAGSLEVILKFLPEIRNPIDSTLIFILHRKSTQTDDVLTHLFSSKSDLPVKEVEDKEIILPNRVYLAPAGYHLLIEKERTFSLDISEKVNYSRPSIDITFFTAAEAFGKNLIGVLLSGGNSDGTEGLKKIKRHGGRTFVQDPQTAQIPFMPSHAYESGGADGLIDPTQIALLVQNPTLFTERI